ncbi:MAG: hypothetical protein QXL82_02100 [Candidatus Aenigmatarchaeota archaeon]
MVGVIYFGISFLSISSNFSTYLEAASKAFAYSLNFLDVYLSSSCFSG